MTAWTREWAGARAPAACVCGSCPWEAGCTCAEMGDPGEEAGCAVGWGWGRRGVGGGLRQPSVDVIPFPRKCSASHACRLFQLPGTLVLSAVWVKHLLRLQGPVGCPFLQAAQCTPGGSSASLLAPRESQLTQRNISAGEEEGGEAGSRLRVALASESRSAGCVCVCVKREKESMSVHLREHECVPVRVCVLA